MLKFRSKPQDASKDRSTPSAASHDVLSAAPAANAEGSPWIRAGIAYEDRVMRSQAQVANWRLFAFIAIGVAAIAVVGVIWIGLKSKFVPMVFEVDRLGQTVAVKALYGDEAVTDSNRLVYREMFDLFENLRTVTTDRDANNDRLRKGFARLKGSAAIYVRAELRKAPPNEVGAKKTIKVTVRSALKQTGKSWQVDWDETSYALTGEQMGVPEHWRATVQYELGPSSDEKEFRSNPIGFGVPELSWQQIAERNN